jgi:hypothetical protein
VYHTIDEQVEDGFAKTSWPGEKKVMPYQKRKLMQVKVIYFQERY